MLFWRAFFEIVLSLKCDAQLMTVIVGGIGK
jgi:hypothetical protein